MTNTEIIQAIRAEIERRITDNTFGAKLELIDILAWLDTLELEKEQPDFPITNEQVKEFLATHPKVEVPQKYKTPDWIFEKSEKPVPNDLEEAADNHIREVADAAGHPGWDWTTQDIADAFIAGAKWQKEQIMKSPLVSIGNTASEELQRINYENGKKDMKEQMMKEAVEGEVVKDINNKLAVTAKNVNLDGFKFGDKVRIIIVKE